FARPRIDGEIASGFDTLLEIATGPEPDVLSRSIVSGGKLSPPGRAIPNSPVPEIVSPPATFSAAMSSSIDPYRSSGRFSRHRYTSSSSACGTTTDGTTSRIFGSGSDTCAIRVLTELPLSNGTFPHNVSNITTPSEYTSVAGVTRSPRICSGAMYFGDPMNNP